MTIQDKIIKWSSDFYFFLDFLVLSPNTVFRYLTFSYLIVATTTQEAYVIAVVLCGIAELRGDVLILIDR
ncbi:hypothetical protein CPU03_01655 [Edwardsiella tarda]|uniref:Uncharacterized protein n=1 Tax=Edwardsiella tarda TaxID=636 RepID=A0A2A7U446_EDWTA|nr:hypothetical protein CPU03_01655 [Edwardsiella tarda]PEH73067.1 hypothetical protein CRM76_14570 [Edwardsiella tarda]